MDLIGRTATIDAIEQHKTAVLKGLEVNEGIAYGYAAAHIHLVEIVRKLPSAERRGRWIEIRNVAFPHLLCSECKKPFYGSYSDAWNYCPNCGARMVSEDDS